MADKAVSRDDLMNDAFIHILERIDSYKPEKATFLAWCHWKAYRFFQSYFRQLANRQRLRTEKAETSNPGRKGIWHHGTRQYFPEMPQAEYAHAVGFGKILSSLDSRSNDEWMIDLRDAIEAIEDSVIKQIIDLVILGRNDDQIGWELNIHPTTVSLRRREGLKILAEKLGYEYEG